jgi:hypothetical protein
MKKYLMCLSLLLSSLFVSYTFADDYNKTTMDNHRFEMLQISYGAHAYNIKFDKWTGNIWLYSKEGVSIAMRDPMNSDIKEQDQKCIYQLMKGNVSSVESCFVLNTMTGEVWEVSFKGSVAKYSKKQ